MLIPTGVDCVIGGHAGDATPAARLLANVSDHLIVHPNVVNASDVNEQTENTLYAEGSLICRLMMGTVGLRKVRQNRVLLITENRKDAPNVVDQTINCAEGARATLGMDISEVVVLEKELFMQTGVSDSGRVTGRVERLGHLLDLLAEKRSEYDAIALATRITPHIDTVQLHRSYFGEGGPNPWGGVEAILTHLISGVLDVPSAHAPTMSSEALRTESWGVVEPRKAMEIISTTYLFCVLKGLNRAPQIITNPTGCLRSVGDQLRRRFGAGDSGWLRGLANLGGRRAGHPRDRGAWQHEPDAERPAIAAVQGGPAPLRGQLLRSRGHHRRHEGGRRSGDPHPSDAADADQPRRCRGAGGCHQWQGHERSCQRPHERSHDQRQWPHQWHQRQRQLFNGKTRKVKSVVTVEAAVAEPEMLVEVGGQ